MGSGLMQERHARTSVSALAYHLVWATKYRRPVLVDQVAVVAKQLFSQKLNALDGQMIAADIMPDHVHLFVALPATATLPRVVHRLKGTSARYLLQHHPVIKRQLWGGHLWNPSYWASTVGNVSAAGVARYSAEQRGK